MGGSAPSDSLEKQQSNYELAKISRDQWEDYKQRFMPVEKRLASQIGTQSAFDAGFAKRQIPQAFAMQQQALGRDFARLGVTATPEQQAAMDQNLALQRASALVGSANAARLGAEDRDMAILSGGMATMNRNIRGSAQPTG